MDQHFGDRLGSTTRSSTWNKVSVRKNLVQHAMPLGDNKVVSSKLVKPTVVLGDSLGRLTR